MTQQEHLSVLISTLCEQRAIARRDIKRRNRDLADAVADNLPEIDNLRTAVVAAELVAEKYDAAIWAVDKVAT